MKTDSKRYIARPKNNFLIGIVSGVVLGFTLGYILAIFIISRNVKDGAMYEVLLIILGAILGIVFERGFSALQIHVKKLQSLNPLRSILGTIHTEDSWIYIHPWKRNVFESELHTIEPEVSDTPSIVGSSIVYGEGDSLALALILRVMEKIGTQNNFSVVETQRAIGSWGRSAISIGAHNKITLEIIEKFENPYFLFRDNRQLIVKPDTEFEVGGEKFVKGVRIKNSYDTSTIDYGIILKLKDNSHSPHDKTVIVIAGLGDNGTAGAAYFLLNHYEKLPFDRETFGELIEVPSGYQTARRVEDFNKVAKNYRKRW